MDIRKDSIINVDIQENISLQKSLAYSQDKKIVIEGGYAGQNADIRLKKLRPRRWEAVLEKVISSPEFVIPPACVDFGRCGGCSFLDLTYEKQLEMKEAYVRNLFGNAKLEYDSFESIIPAPSQFRYRNKMEFSFGDSVKGGELTLGMHERNRHHNIISLNSCCLVPDDFNMIKNAAEAFFRNLGTPFYNTYTKNGFLRHLVIRHSVYSSQLLINLVTTSSGHLDSHSFTETLLSLELENKIEGILHTINDSHSDAVKNQGMKIIYGNDFITEKIHGLSFKITPFSFFQTNSLGAESLYSKAFEYIKDMKNRTVFDLYCGTGTITQMAALFSDRVIGVDIVRESIDSASENAEINNIENCSFICSDVFDALQKSEDKPDIVILDPPRSGAGAKAAEKLVTFEPETILYISCKPSSLVKDLETFVSSGYHITNICPVDMFPNTVHVETVVLLSKLVPQTHIR